MARQTKAPTVLTRISAEVIAEVARRVAGTRESARDYVDRAVLEKLARDEATPISG